MRKINQFKDLKNIERAINKNLYKICGVITVAAMAMALIEFLTRGLFPSANINLFYLGVLIIYAFHKELVRWLGKKEVERQGEYFVYGWIILATSLYVINFFSRGYFSYSTGGLPLATLRNISFLTLEVLVIFFSTRALKILRVLLIKPRS